jgi:exodeoxyribonuclease VII small subunit
VTGKGSNDPAATPNAAQAPSEEGFDQIVEKLRALVEKLEGGSLTLEQSLATFEDGVRLSRRGAEILDSAERRVDVLLRGESGALETTPFPSDDRNE